MKDFQLARLSPIGSEDVQTHETPAYLIDRRLMPCMAKTNQPD